MEKLTKTPYCYTFVLLILLAVKVKGRSLQHTSSSELVSDGIDHVQDNQSSFLLLKKMDSSEECEQLYAFLPCSNSLLSHLFLIVVYEYLLFHGESCVASGGKRIFKILGPGVFGASAFQILGALPDSLILLASGLLNSKEEAQEYVLTGVGLLAGSTILLLTLLWGTCVIVGSRDFPNNLKAHCPSVTSNSIQNRIEKFLSSLTGSGITTDSETSSTARIMVLSVIPFVIILIPKIFHLSSYAEHIVIIIALIVALVFLLWYFIYQIFNPWIQKRQLEYVKHEHLAVDILKHFQARTMGRLLTDDGAPNVPAIRRLFLEIDQDGDNNISVSELKELLHQIRYRKFNQDMEQTVEEVMKEFDVNGDKKITVDEFVNVIKKWLDETKQAMDKRYHSVKSLKDFYQVLEPWIQKTREERQKKKHLISEFIRHVQSSTLGSLTTEDGTPDICAIKRFFETIDHDRDNCISQPQLKELIMDIDFGMLHLDREETVAKIIEELDVNGDQIINGEEFVSVFSTWLTTSSNQAPPNSTESEDDFYQNTWEEIDMLIEKEIDRSVWAWTKAIMLLVLGIVVLAVLAEPLIYSVQNFSTSANIPSFFISFILVPLATTARGAISALTAASRKKPRTTFLTFSEIYDGVFMNNVLGFSVLLSLIYFRGLSWHFSAEVLIVLIVCAIMGLAASFRSTFPLWTSSVAFLLYPLSLILVFVLDDFLSWT